MDKSIFERPPYKFPGEVVIPAVYPVPRGVPYDTEALLEFEPRDFKLLTLARNLPRLYAAEKQHSYQAKIAGIIDYICKRHRVTPRQMALIAWRASRAKLKTKFTGLIKYEAVEIEDVSPWEYKMLNEYGCI